MDGSAFRQLLETIARAWNEGDTTTASTGSDGSLSRPSVSWARAKDVHLDQMRSSST